MKYEIEERNRYEFPEGIDSVTGGRGGDATLVHAYDKTFLIDCGMACFGRELVANIKEILGERSLDYLFVTHTHYDHLGAMSYLRETWKDLKVWSSSYGKKVLVRPGCRNTIESFSEKAGELYNKNIEKFKQENFYVDYSLEHEEKVDLGGGYLVAVESMGHTNCSMAYHIMPMDYLFTSESTGVYLGEDIIEATVLKSFEDSMRAVRYAKERNSKHIILPHYGNLPERLKDTYFDMYEKVARDEKKAIENMIKASMSHEEILEELKRINWVGDRQQEQHLDAFLINAANTIEVYRKEMEKL